MVILAIVVLGTLGLSSSRTTPSPLQTIPVGGGFFGVTATDDVKHPKEFSQLLGM
jgi:hypothetical protein